jgi:Uma2 family endonuclease
MSVAQWGDLPEDAEGELVGGLLVEEEMGSLVHEQVVAWLIVMLGNWGFPRGARVLASDARFALARDRGRKADASVYLPGSAAPERRGAITVPPSIMIEVVTPTPRDVRRDRVEKLAEYETFGVRWYWLVDPELRTFQVFELGADGRYVHALSASGGTIEIPGCTGLELDLDGLWRIVDDANEDHA